MHFNISHTTSLIACGIAMDANIGIDIEEKKRKTTKSIVSLARRFFTPSEANYLAQISDSYAQEKEFVKLWTLKVNESLFGPLLYIALSYATTDLCYTFFRTLKSYDIFYYKARTYQLPYHVV